MGLVKARAKCTDCCYKNSLLDRKEPLFLSLSSSPSLFRSLSSEAPILGLLKGLQPGNQPFFNKNSVGQRKREGGGGTIERQIECEKYKLKGGVSEDKRIRKKEEGKRREREEKEKRKEERGGKGSLR